MQTVTGNKGWSLADLIAMRVPERATQVAAVRTDGKWTITYFA